MTVQTGTRGHVGDSFGKPSLDIIKCVPSVVFEGTFRNIQVQQLFLYSPWNGNSLKRSVSQLSLNPPACPKVGKQTSVLFTRGNDGFEFR